MQETTIFWCGTCETRYQVVRAEAPPANDKQLLCLGCGAPLRNREGRFALKYSEMENWSETASSLSWFDGGEKLETQSQRASILERRFGSAAEAALLWGARAAIWISIASVLVGALVHDLP